MPRVFVLSGPDVGKSTAFEETVELGRSPEVAVVLRSASVSRRHARILHEGGRWWLEDLGSINGTTLAGRRIERAELADGSLFQLGELELRFRLESPASPASSGGSSTTVLEADESGDDPGSAAAPDSRGDDAGGFELEGDWDDTVPAPAASASPASPVSPVPPVPPVPATRPRAARAGAGAAGAGARAALEATQVRRGEQSTPGGGRILQYKNVANRGGFFSADLAQYPFWVRATVALLLVALFVGLTYGAFHLTAMLRGRGSGEVNVESTP